MKEFVYNFKKYLNYINSDESLSNTKFYIYKEKEQIKKKFIRKKTEKYLKGKVNLRLCKTLNNAVISIFKDTKNVTHKKIIIL